MNRGPGNRMNAQQNQFEGAKNTRQSLIKITKSLKPYLPAVILALLLALIGTILQVLGPDRLKLLTDEIMRGLPNLINGVPTGSAINFNALWTIALTLILFYSGSALLSLVQGFIMTTVTQRFSKGLRDRVLIVGVNSKIAR